LARHIVDRYSAMEGDHLRRCDLDWVERARARQPPTEKTLGHVRHGIEADRALKALMKLPYTSPEQLRGLNDTVGDLVHWNAEEPVKASRPERHDEVSESTLSYRVGNAERLWSQNSHRRGCNDLASAVIKQVRTRYIAKMKDE
jgi:hypothetical protein